MPVMEASASLRGVTVRLDDREVLRDINLDLEPGLLAVRGVNGAGKTTLLRTLAGLTPIAKGERVIRSTVLTLGHRPQLLRGLSVLSNLSFFARYRGLDTAIINDALARWGLSGVANRPVDRLSAGQRRRAALARLDTEPCAVVLIDEPFAELDDEGVALLHSALARVVARGAAVCVATHGHTDLRATRSVLVVDGGIR